MTGIVEENDETTESVTEVDSGVLSGKQLDEENSEKLDSGMDEEMTGTSPTAPDLNSDSEDEPVVIRKKTKKQMVLDDDDDTNDVDNGSEKEEEKSEADDDISSKVSKKKTIDEAVSAILDSDSDEETTTKEAQKTGDSSGEESDSLTEIIKKRKGKKQIDDNEESATESSQKKSQLFNSDLFDAEDSDSDNNGVADDNASDRDSDKSESENSNADDEGFGDEMDPKLKAKLMKMKGAAKKPRRGGERKAKPKTESLMDIHSESQRLIRESQVVLPYHQPTPKPINDFLARAMKKQQDYRALRAGKEFKKPSVIQHVIANCSPAVTNTPSQTKKEIKTDNPTPIVDFTKPTETCNTHTATENKEGDTQKPESNMELGEDELPDLDDDAVNHVKKTLDFDTESKPADQILTESKEKESENVVEESEVMEVDPEVQAAEKPPSEDIPDSTKNKDTTNNDPDGQDKIMSDNDVIAFMTAPSTEESSVPETQGEELAVPDESPKAKAIIDVLPELKNVTPRLSGGPEAFIDFENSSDTPKLSGMDKLKDRFLSHSKKKTQKKAKDVDISIVEKESGPGDTTKLRMTSITYHVQQEEDSKLKQLDKPGAKLLALKEQLQSRMKVKREEARQKRQEIYALENEEGFEEENEEEKLLDDDAEMSDKSDTDIEDDQFDAEFGEEEFEEEDEKVRNPFADEEADEDDDDFDPEKASNKGSDDDDEIDSDEDDAPMKLQLDTSDDGEDSELENPSQNVRSSGKKKHKQVRKLNISDDEESNLSPAQPSDREAGTGSFKLPTNTVLPKDSLEEDDDELSPLSKHLAPTQTQKEPKRLAMTLAVEDSQDLYGNTGEPYTGLTYPAGDTQPSQGLNFMVEDSQSQMLDADGFFKVKSTTKKPTSASLGLHNINSTQDNMSELMGLCSGRFAEPNQDESKKTSAKQLFSDGPGSLAPTQDNVSDELLGLCSGFFPGDNTQKPKSQGTKRKLEDDEGSNESFALMSDNENHMDSDKDELEDKEEDQCDEVDGDASRDSTAKTKDKFRGFRGRITGKLRKEFVDEEAELSGSEYDSDEDLDLAEEDDIMELEAGDQDVTLNEEELRNQVGRAHLKETIDSDKREIMRLQEMYLPDGDLYSDGNGRMRRFRWKNMDDESQQDMFDGNGSEDDGPEEDADELRWRMERFEREKFLQEEREKEENETGSQFFKLGKKFALKIKEPVSKPEADFKKPPRADKKENTSPVKPLLRSASKRKGSFLTRSKEALAKIAERTKSSVNPNATRNSRNFVFQHVSPDKSDAQTQPKPVPKPAAAKKKPMQPPAKRQRTKTVEAKPGSSIFNILER